MDVIQMNSLRLKLFLKGLFLQEYLSSFQDGCDFFLMLESSDVRSGESEQAEINEIYDQQVYISPMV